MPPGIPTISPGGFPSPKTIIPGSSRPTGTSGFVFPPPMGFGAGQGPVQSTGQQADNPFNNSFFFQVPTSPAFGAPSDNSSQNAASPSNGGYGQYVPIIIVGVIVAGLGYYLFQRKGK